MLVLEREGLKEVGRGAIFSAQIIVYDGEQKVQEAILEDYFNITIKPKYEQSTFE